MSNPINYILMDMFPSLPILHRLNPRGPQMTGTRANAAGNVYRGDVAPMTWIQREQQRGSTPPTELMTESARLRDRGNRLFRRGNYEEAIRWYTDAIAHDPKDELNFSNRSFAYFKMGKFAESAEDARQSVAINPSFFKGYYRLGVAQAALGKHSEAMMNLRLALENIPDGESKEAIRIAMQKCESRLSRTPSIQLLAESSTATAAVAPMDMESITKSLSKTVGLRKDVEALDSILSLRSMLSKQTQRSQRARALLSITKSADFTCLLRGVDEAQEQLRKASRIQDRQAYHEAKASRDQAMKKLWDSANSVTNAIAELEALAADERRFFEKYGGASNGADEHGEVVSSSEAAVDADSYANKPEALADGSSAEEENVDALLSQFDETMERLKELQAPAKRTDESAAAFLAALEAEQSAVAAIQPYLAKARQIDEKLRGHTRRVAARTVKELSDSRLEFLEAIKVTASRIQSDAATFQRASDEGDALLVEEASLERDRLMFERQRIQLQAEIEWLKVKDEPTTKISSLQNRLATLKSRLAAISEQQSKVQRRIVALINADHPELAWKSAAGGSRILRMVKGSGLWISCSFSDFDILATLSSTANSKVYHGKWKGDHVALKEIPVDGEKAKRRFQSEINIIATSNHRNILRIIGVFFDGPFAYILMPYFSRGSLRTFWSKKEPLQWYVVQDLLRQLASGVAYLHERGIVHADIKPSNILLSDDLTPILADFGIAKDIGLYGERADMTTTQTGIVGTVNFMAPELLHESGHPSPKSDIWSLGITFHNIATTNAHLRDPETVPEPSLPTISPGNQLISILSQIVGNSDRLADLISSMLMVDPKRRPTAQDVMGHPYFSMSLVGLGEGNDELVKSDEKLEAIRAFTHALRSNQRRVLISVARNMMVESVNNVFGSFAEAEILSPVMVVFQGEMGVDEGALTTEMLNLYYQQLVTRHRALVTSQTGHANLRRLRAAEGIEGSDAEDKGEAILYGASYVPSDAQDIPTSLFECLGKMLVKNIFENRSLPIHLNPSVFRYLCGKNPTMQDLELYDEQLASNLKKLPLLSDDDFKAVDMDFSDFDAGFLEAEVGDRITQSTKITTANVRQFINLRVKFELVSKRESALKAMLAGFRSFPTLEFHLRLLTPTELMLLLCGQQHLQPQLIVQALEFQGFTESSKTPEHLVSLISEMSQNTLRRFLQLCTSSVTIPENGLTRKIKVLCTQDTQRLPVGHGCVHQLDAPDYNDREILREKLYVALAHVNDGFHIQ